ncbi:hypothetical protein EYF80_040751 [Liparis tanakae]|uniref:Uncharacterized protein n=1 Tax=Liparis tanakae TaxID=230148 RepID=A0A4Z2G7X6_9TELE|nr:hypothetical protein EYF80_040751 [Liparis tanakae]
MPLSAPASVRAVIHVDACGQQGWLTVLIRSGDRSGRQSRTEQRIPVPLDARQTQPRATGLLN